eukprot:Platyproteum_vivax@DN7108_c0_g1_i3.p2
MQYVSALVDAFLYNGSHSIMKIFRDLEKAGDWERRNKLRVYEGVYCILLRDFKQAANLFLGAVATFTSSELMPFEEFIFLTVVLSLVALDRPTVRSKVLHAPEVLQVVQDLPDVKMFMESLYNCRYNQFMVAFGTPFLHDNSLL